MENGGKHGSLMEQSEVSSTNFSSFMPVAHINFKSSCTIQLSLTHLESILQVHAMSLSHVSGNRRDYLKHFFDSTNLVPWTLETTYILFSLLFILCIFASDP